MIDLSREPKKKEEDTPVGLLILIFMPLVMVLMVMLERML